MSDRLRVQPTTTIDSGAQTYVSTDDLSVALSDGVLSTMNRPEPELTDRGHADRNRRRDGAGRGGSRCRWCAQRRRRLQFQRRHQAPRIRPEVRGALTSVLDTANRAVQAIVALPQPVVAVVQGPAAGVGVSLALASMSYWPRRRRFSCWRSPRSD